MRTLLYLSTFAFAVFLMPACSSEKADGTFVNFTLIDGSGIPQGGRSIYVFKESDDVVLNKKPAEAINGKTTDIQGKVQFNLENPDAFGEDQSAVFSFQVMEFSGGEYIVISSFEKEIKPGDIVSKTLTLK